MVSLSKSRVMVILLPILIILVAVALLIYFVASKPVQAPVEVKEKVWLVETMPVVFESLSPVHRLYGKVESFSMVDAAAPVSGEVATVWVKEGVFVKAGEPLVSMSLADLDIPLQQAKADVADAQAQVALQKLVDKANKQRLAHENSVLALKRTNVERTEQLIQKDLASQSDLDQVKETLVRQEYVVVGATLAVEEGGVKNQQIKARLLKAKAELAQAKLNKQRGQVVAPYDLRVTKVGVSEGSRVNVGTVLVQFYGVDSLELRAKLPVTILNQVQSAMNKGIALSASYQRGEEEVTLPLSRLAGEATTSGLDAFFTLPAQLTQARPGDLMEVDLQGERLERVVAIPYRALYGQDRVYFVQEGRLQAQTVRVLGEVFRAGKLWALIDPTVGDLVVNKQSKICITHLPNAVSGLKVSEVTK
ncbi:MAG: biotin/lipoyl-binding protein [Thiomicrorhabdus sp.]|nr:biotin/lipoyl-binding protein [Thiomicrorhabdus sp.]